MLGDENLKSSVVAETTELLANSSYVYQIMDWSRLALTKYLSDKKKHMRPLKKLFKKLDHVNNSLYVVELAKAEIEHKEPIIVRFFILQYAKLHMLELYYNSITSFCDVHKFEVLEMGTDSLSFVPAGKELEHCMRLEMRAEWQKLWSIECVDSFTADAVAEFFPRICCVKHKQHGKRDPGLFKEEFKCREMFFLCSKAYCCYDVTSTKPIFSSKGLKKCVLEQSADEPLENFRRVLNEKVNVSSKDRGFQTKKHSAATYEQSTIGLCYF